MWTCKLCRFEVVLDDVQLKFTSGMVICVTCFARETATDRHMSGDLRREVTAAVTEVQP